MHKCYTNIKFDAYGNVDWSQDLSPIQHKFFELRENYREVPEDMFTKAFDSCWKKFNSNFEGMEFDMELEPLKMEAEMKQSRANADFDRRD